MYHVESVRFSFSFISLAKEKYYIREESLAVSGHSNTQVSFVILLPGDQYFILLLNLVHTMRNICIIMTETMIW